MGPSLCVSRTCTLFPTWVSDLPGHLERRVDVSSRGPACVTSPISAHGLRGPVSPWEPLRSPPREVCSKAGCMEEAWGRPLACLALWFSRPPPPPPERWDMQMARVPTKPECRDGKDLRSRGLIFRLPGPRRLLYGTKPRPPTPCTASNTDFCLLPLPSSRYRCRDASPSPAYTRAPDSLHLGPGSYLSNCRYELHVR